MKNGFNTGSRDDLAIDLESCLVQVEASKAWFTPRILPLSLEQLRWRPGQDRWSIAQCLDHLNITLGLVLPKVDAAVQEGWRNGQMGDGQTGYDPSEVAALKLVDPPVMAPAAAPTATQPATSIDLDRMVDEFHQTRDHYAEAVAPRVWARPAAHSCARGGGSAGLQPGRNARFPGSPRPAPHVAIRANSQCCAIPAEVFGFNEPICLRLTRTYTTRRLG